MSHHRKIALPTAPPPTKAVLVLFILAALAGCATAQPRQAAPPTSQPAPVLEMTLDQLGNFDFDEDHPVIPDRVMALNGSTVRIRGFMVPMDQAENIARLALVKSLFRPNYSPPDPVQKVVVVQCPPGKVVKYFPDEIVVEGKLIVGIVREDGFLMQIFTLEATSVTAVPQDMAGQSH